MPQASLELTVQPGPAINSPCTQAGVEPTVAQSDREFTIHLRLAMNSLCSIDGARIHSVSGAGLKCTVWPSLALKLLHRVK